MNRHNLPLALPPDMPGPAFRSGAAARMAQLPVATLRIWEQRYQAVRPITAASGHRLYSAADVQRVMLLRQLTEQGHAIGAIAALDTPQLQDLTGQPVGAVARAAAGPARLPAAPRLVVVGHALAARLQRPAVAQRLPQPAKLVAVFASLAEASHATAGSACDLLICQLPGLQAGIPPELQAAQAAWHPARLAVVYRFANAAARAAWAGTGACLLREPLDDDDLGTWLLSLQASEGQQDRAASNAADKPQDASLPSSGRAIAERRFDDAALTAIAGLSPTLACECPRHVAELLMQLSSFEAYSAGCIDRSPADARLHAYLREVAGTSRAMFEQALESVARHEGLNLG